MFTMIAFILVEIGFAHLVLIPFGIGIDIMLVADYLNPAY
jgi:hypothetical protein